MKSDLSIEFSRVTEAAALAAHDWLGRGDKHKADHAAVQAMREELNTLQIEGEIVIGEGEIDNAPMLYIGEKVGQGHGDAVDIAVDPIEGTRMTAMGQSNALSVIAVAERGGFLKAPDMYMEKLIVGPKAHGVIDMNQSLESNLKNVSQALGKPIEQLTVITLAKPRHEETIAKIQALGARVYAIPDGDVAASILTCMPESPVDMLYCIGGAPEGVVSAAVIRSMRGDMQAKLIPRHRVKGDSEENKKLGEQEIQRCREMGIEVNKILKLNDLVKDNNVLFVATGITKGDLLDGVRIDEHIAETETLIIKGDSRVVRKIRSTHVLD